MPKAHAGPARPISHVGPAQLPILYVILRVIQVLFILYVMRVLHIVHLFPEDLADWNALRSCYIAKVAPKVSIWCSDIFF